MSVLLKDDGTAPQDVANVKEQPKRPSARELCKDALQDGEEVYEGSQPALYQILARFVMPKLVDEGMAMLLTEISTDSSYSGSIYMYTLKDVEGGFARRKN